MQINLQNFLALLSETKTIVATMKGPRHVFDYVNAAHIELLGQNALGREVREVQPEAVEAGVLALLDSVYLEGKTIEISEAAIPIAQELRYFSFIYAPSRDSEGAINGVMALANDITQIVTTRKLIEARERELHEVQDQLAKAVSIAKVGFYDWNIIEDKVIFSEQMKADWGFAANSTLQDILQYIHVLDRTRVVGLIEESIRSNSPYHTIYRVTRPSDGQVIWIEAQGEVHRDASGQAVRFFGTSHNITERKDFEDRLAAERFKLNAIFQNSPALMAIWQGPEFIFEQVNPEYQKLFRDRQLVGHPLAQALPELTGQPFLQMLKQVFETGESQFSRETSAFLAPDDHSPPQEHFFDFTFVRMLDEKGKPYGVFNHAIEVTAQVRARKKIEENEAALLLAQEQLNLALDSAQMGSWYIDLKSKVVHASSGFAKLVGVEKIEGSALAAVNRYVHPEDRDKVTAGWHQAVADRKMYHQEYRILRSDDAIRWVESRGNIKLGADSVPEFVSGIIFDVTDRKMRTLEDQRLNQELKSAIAARDTFLSIASHELRTPITGMSLQAQMIARVVEKDGAGAVKPERIVKFVQQTTGGLLKMSKLVEDMLDISKIELGRLVLNRELTDLPIFIQTTLESYAEELSLAGIALEFSSQSLNPTALIDRFRFEQVFTNLITNAIRYAPKTFLKINVTETPTHLNIVFVDGGKGILPANRQRIFQRYERLISANEVSGLGLGLYIVREIVNAHGGSIEVIDDLHGGASFQILIPKA